MFANTIKSNGFSVDFMFNKRIANHTSSKTNVALEFEDFDLKAVNQHYQPMILDHRRKSVFTAAIGLDKTKHQIRHCSTAEYYRMTGSTKYLKTLERPKVEKGIKGIETSIPSLKIF